MRKAEARQGHAPRARKNRKAPQRLSKNGNNNSTTQKRSEGNDENEWWKHDPKVVPEPLKNGVSRWSTRLFNNGVFEHVQVLPGSISPDGPGAIDGHALEHAIVSMADRLSRAYGELGFGDSALIGVTLYGSPRLRSQTARQLRAHFRNQT